MPTSGVNIELSQTMDFTLAGLAFFTFFANIHDSYPQFPTNEAEVVMTAVDRLSANIEVTCGFNEDLGPPLWVINGEIYNLFLHKLDFLVLDGLYSIRIPNVSRCLDNNTFQCLSSTIHPPGRVTRLFVRPNPFIGSPMCPAHVFSKLFVLPSQESQRNLQIDTQNINIGSNTTTFEFFSSHDCRNFQFHLLIYDMIGANPRDNITLECCNGSFPSTELVSSDDGISYFHLMSLTNNASCADNTIILYTFNDVVTNQSYIKSNESVCYEFPASTPQCDFSVVSLQMSLSRQCNIVIHPSHTDFESYPCYRGFSQYKVRRDDNNSRICLFNWNVPSGHITVQFVCLKTCPLENCNEVYNFVSSYEIFVEQVSPTIMATTEEVNTVPLSTHSDTVVTSFTTTATSNSSADTTGRLPQYAIALIVLAIIVVICIIIAGIAIIVIVVWKFIIK